MAKKSEPRNRRPGTQRLLVSFGLLLCGLLLILTFNSRVCAQERPQPNTTIRVTILYLNEVHQLSPVDPTRGSLGRVSTLVKLIRKESPNTIFVLAGNTISPSTASKTWEGRQMIAGWNAADLDLAVLGDREFDFGSKVLQLRIEESRFTWLGANVFQGKGNLEGVLATRYFRFGNVKLAILGLMSPISEVSGISFLNPTEVAREWIARDQKSGTKIFIALTNMSLPEDLELARNVPDITAIIGGRSNVVTKALVGRTPIFKTSADAFELGRLDLNFDPLRGELLSIDSAIIPVTSETPEDPQFALLRAKFLDISERQAGDVTILNLDGNINIGEGSVVFRSEIKRLLQEGKKKILLNLANVGDIDDSGIGELVSGYQAITKERGQLKLLNLTQRMQSLLTITKLLTVFDVYDNEKEALASFK